MIMMIIILGGFIPRYQSNQGLSIWDYIEKHHRKSTVFMNFLYSPTDQDSVLRPYSNLSNLRIWDFYLTEDLAHGPAYEIETTNKEIQISEEEKTDSSGQPLLRKMVNGCYDNVSIQLPNVFRQMLLVSFCWLIFWFNSILKSQIVEWNEISLIIFLKTQI